MLAEYSGTTFEPVLRRAVERICDRMSDKVKIDAVEFASIVKFKPVGIINIPRQVFYDLNRACAKNKSVEIDYLAAHNGQKTKRTIDPYRMIESRGAWYVVGYCHLRNDMRMFALHRIESYNVLEAIYELRFNEEQLDQWSSAAFLLEHGDAEQEVSIGFNASAARYVRERSWHPSQKLEDRADGGCTLSFTTCRLDEVKRWVLEYGANAEVLSPPELRDIVAAEFCKGAELYNKKPSLVRDSAAQSV
jgi:predicted DNA-binding transcriptional regulator YafY